MIVELAPQNSPLGRLDNLMLSTDVNAVYITVDAIQISNGTFLGSSTLVIANSSINTGNTSPGIYCVFGCFFWAECSDFWWSKSPSQ